MATAARGARSGNEIAIVGMACRLPGAVTVEEFWRNLEQGVESLTRVSADDLRRGGLDPALLDDPAYVPMVPALADVESFDAGFFDYTPLEARLMDPQQRLFLECAWEAFEHAGYDPARVPGAVGVFTGSKTNTYLFQLFSNRAFFRGLDTFQIALGNDLACMATRVSYKLDLRGPSYALHTACSTSLVAVHLACQSLLLGECELALAGAAAVNVPQRRGYRFQKGGILSPDGSCRTFDADAQGSNFGNGVGAVLLKRLDDALRDGDHVYAVIRGSAVNNDGARKASYTAPGVEGQTHVLIDALAAADVEADSISYVEAHGTATDLGDSIELLALTQAYRAGTARVGFCALGSVKTNLGHLETAAGVAGLIKTALALERRLIPASLHFRRPNPKIDFASSPFYVNTEPREWRSEGPRRAGVSSFGIGSTNAHVILEQAPEPEPPGTPARPAQLLVLSARSASALETATRRLAAHLRRGAADTPATFADVAYTLHLGRRGFGERRVLVARDAAQAAALLEARDPGHVLSRAIEPARRPLAFLFPGLGDQAPGVGAALRRHEPVFREEVERCAETLRPLLGVDLRELLFPAGGDGARPDLRRLFGRAPAAPDAARERLERTEFAQPATFVVEYALARLWMSWGLRPQALLGYSLGEYVAACLAGVLALDDALRLVARRAQLIQALPEGTMLALPVGEAEAAALAREHGLSLAAVNGPLATVVAGATPAVAALEARLAERGVVSRRLATTHAFHSDLLAPAAEELTRLAGECSLAAPRIPYVSNVSGTWVQAADARDPGYWARHMCAPVRFADGVGELLRERRVLLEVGPGQSLTSAVKQHPACGPEAAALALASLPGAFDRQDEHEFVLGTLGKLWLTGQEIDWGAFHRGERRRRVALPTYPFERQRYWVDPPEIDDAGRAAAPAAGHVTLDKRADVAEWTYVPVWNEAALAAADQAELPAGRALVFRDAAGLGALVAERLRAAGRDVVEVVPGPAFARGDAGVVTLDPRRPQDYTALLQAAPGGGVPALVLHLWSLDPLAPGDEGFERAQDLGFYSLLFLAQALGRAGVGDGVRVEVVSSGLHRVRGDERLEPAKATLLGPARVVPQEFPRVVCRSVDVEPPSRDRLDALAAALFDEWTRAPDGTLVAYRDGRRHVQGFAPHPLGPVAGTPARLRPRGVYLITGGAGGLGLALAEHLARSVQARLVLTSRSELPAREAWSAWLESHPHDDATSARLRALLRLEELGAEVLALPADASDADAMRRVLAAAEARFGALHGVVHLAGVPGGGIVQLKTREMAERILAPKVQGARVLDALVAGRELDFLMCYSSIASVLGEFGQADYCGANAFLDAFAQERTAAGRGLTLAVNWDVWQEVGLAVHTEVPAHLREWRREMLAKAIHPSEGLDAFARVLEAGLPQVVVSAQDLPGRIELGRRFTGEGFLQELSRAQPAPAAGAAAPARRVLGTSFVAAGAGLERRIAAVWQRVLGLEQVGVHDNFFELGGNSLIGLQLVSELSRELDTQIAPVTLFEAPTVSALTRALRPEPAGGTRPGAAALAERRRLLQVGAASKDVAIVGMAGRFPGARNVEELWANLCAGVESVTFFGDDELRAAGVAAETIGDPRYVKAGAILQDVDLFDAELFGYSPREAEVMDPQHRVFLECAWEALEHAGCDPQSYPGLIGVYAGSNLSTYLLRLHADPRLRRSVNMLQAILGNDKDSLTTAVSYKLDLRGPSVAVQTFCSTSLVAVHMACQALRRGECDMALAGGIRIVVPDHQGYLFERGGIAPSDGHTRSFDARADGSILAHGVGLVVLKRLDEALADGDHVHAVIKGSAINNDGSLKAGYTAPSVAGQADAVAAAFEDAGLSPETLGYLEAHGSATELGDPIEVTALTQAFRRHTDKTAFCPLGSLKSNLGHLDRAAGVAALIKTALALERRVIPPSINFETPNPKIDFAASPFFVNTTLREWPQEGAPRRAGVNSLGMGGTNVHVVVEEAPAPPPTTPSRPFQLLALSAKTESALEAAAANLAQHLRSAPEIDLADAAFTLQTGRRALEQRRALVCRDGAEAVHLLEGGDPRRVASGRREDGERRLVFLLPGLGGQYAGMARDLYDREPAFRQALDRVCGLCTPALGFDLLRELYPPAAHAQAAAPALDLRRMLGRARSEEDPAAARLQRTDVSQPLLFAVQVALAELWGEWGLRPQALLGYSLGEYTAAYLAGVMALEDAAGLVCARARMIQELPAGALLAVALGESDAAARLGDELSLMAVNAPEQCVVSGPVAAVDALEHALTAEGVACRRLQAGHAFHSKMMEPLAPRLTELARGLRLHPPQVPYLSNVTGAWITPEQATDPGYWAQHLCRPVRFAEAAALLLGERSHTCLELGPPVLSSLLLQHPDAAAAPRVVLAALRHTYETRDDQQHALDTLGRLWIAGVGVVWSGLYARERRRRLVLPSYPFERRRYWIDAAEPSAALSADAAGGEWLYVPSWTRTPAPPPAADGALAGRRVWLLAEADDESAAALAAALRQVAATPAWLHAAGSAAAAPDGVARHGVRFDAADDYAALVASDGAPDVVVHLGGGAAALTALAGGLARAEATAARLYVVGRDLFDVTGDEPPPLACAALLGAAALAPREAPGLDLRLIDLGASRPAEAAQAARRVLAEIAAGLPESTVAWRGAHRWAPSLAAAPAGATAKWRDAGSYLVGGGLGELGGGFAEFLARGGAARLAFVEPPGFPPRDAWDEWLERDGGAGVVSRKIRRLRALEARGCVVDVLAAELGDAASLAAAAGAAQARLGAPDGVLVVVDADDHAGERQAPAERVRALDAALHALDAALGAGPRLRLLIASLRGARRSAGDAARALFLDGFAGCSAARSTAPWASVTWDLPPAEPGDGLPSEPALRRLFALRGTPQVIVSPQPLGPGWHKLVALREGEAPAAAARALGSYARPANLRSAYAAPRTPAEQRIAALWRELLGVGEVGLHDSFLELGGDSLLATRLMARLREQFDLDLPVRLIFEASTVAELAAALERLQAEKERRELEELVRRLDGLSEEDVERELARRLGAAEREP
jgi:acyl transferase domain-containing protein